ncbi:MAG: Rpn family recombination-promoting nuclease/putative transposase [Gemmataceae bacterium]|nr:Rpn family recombination-promoting nuclease/putative transposase [Gemmataceae bacterium]
MAVFANRAAEPRLQPPYQDLLASPRVRRIYLDELTATDAAAPGLTLLQLVTAQKTETPGLVAELLQRARRQSDSERAQVIVELVEELLLRRFTQLNREEVRRMFQLHDLRKSRVWQEAHQQGIEKGIEKGMEKGMTQARQEFVHRLIAKGKPLKEIAELLELPLAQVRRLAGR